MKLDPAKDNLPLPEQDSIRRIAGPSGVAYRGGVQFLNKAGVRNLCLAVIEGRAQGNAGAARRMLERLETL